MKVKLDTLVADTGKMQHRTRTDEDHIERLREPVRNGETPPVGFVRDPNSNARLLYDGFHRVEAARREGLKEIEAEEFDGTVNEAMKQGVENNLIHGLILTKEDMKKAARMLGDTRQSGVKKRIQNEYTIWKCAEEHGPIANKSLAEKCGVSPGTTRKICTRLCESDCLRKEGRGSNVKYSVVPGNEPEKPDFGPNTRELAEMFGISAPVIQKWLNPDSGWAKRRKEQHREQGRKSRAYDELSEDELRRQIAENIGADALSEQYEPRVSWSLEDNKPGSPGTPVLFLSDWHWFETVDPQQVYDSNKFDLETGKARWWHTLKVSIELLQQHLGGEYPGIVVILGGDMVSGSIHEELVETDGAPPLVQAQEAAKLIADGIALIADNFDRVTVYGVPGNHGRNTRRPRTKGYAHHSLDWLAYNIAASYCERLENVAFNCPPVRDLHFEVAGRKFRLTHGDQFKGGDGQVGAFGPVMRGDMRKRVAASMIPGQPVHFDTLLVGHFHSLSFSPRVIMNGSGKGYDEFALSINAPWEPPQQALFTVHPKHGITWFMPILCDEDYSAHALEARKEIA
ncbi:MAG TPA: ParB/RepB/Spo0J family partition protein [Alphaproteobacteria bacterium]|nr:ParB/RepB/Spo0J family partition protein [Alphaproteobacteria bacterium]